MNGEPTAPIQPRRPVRASRGSAQALPEWRARAETLPNLFLDLFTAPDGDEAAGDRVTQSRRRIEAATAAREAAATPELFNLWHDAFDDAPAAAAVPLPANDHPDQPQHDDDRLSRVRAALYDPVDGPNPPAGPSVQMRLAVHAMNGTLIAVAAPVGAAVMTYSLLRGEDMRLTARALTLCGALMTMLNLGLPLV